MSRKIDLTKQLDEDELRYLVDRDMWDALRENADNLGIPAPNLPSARGIRAQVPRKQLRNTDAFDNIAKAMGVQVKKDDGEPTSPTPPPDPAATGSGGPVDYNKLTVMQLKEELDKRRADYEREGDNEGVDLVSYSNSDKKEDLVTKLQLDDDTLDDDGDDS